MNELIEQFAKTVETQHIERLKAEGLDNEHVLNMYKAKVIPGKKYTKVDLGSSGKFMIDAEGNIFGIKAYGVIHRGHNYGNLSTINQYDWSDYYPRKVQ